MTNRKLLVALVAILALCSLALALQKDPDKKKEDKNAPRKIEISGDPAKVRAELIRLEMDAGYIIGDEQISRVIFTEKKATGMRGILGGAAHFRDLFTFASGSNSTGTTIYASTEFCAPGAFHSERMDCRVQSHKHWIERLDKLLASLKATVEGK